jgi:predicted GIY-YIG superfamily endonuclease
VTDYFSKYVLLFPTRAATAKTLVKSVEEGVFLDYGSPQSLMCDNGVQMKSKEFQALCERYKVKLFYTAHYYPRADPTERVNRVVKTMLKSFVDQQNHRTWDENLAAIGCAIRTSRHETTGHSPYFVNFGREHRLYGTDFSERIVQHPDQNRDDFIKKRQDKFLTLFESIRSRIKASRVRNQKRYNLRRRPVQYQVGQSVWRKNKSLSDAVNYYSAKLAPEYVGPFVIKKKTGTWTYELQDQRGNSKGVWHVQDLKPDNPPGNDQT